MFVKAHAASNCKEGLQKTNNFKQQGILHWPKYLPAGYSFTLEHLKVLTILFQKVSMHSALLLNLQ